MANYDNKLGEWFKQVEAQEQELKAKKTGDTPVVREEPKPVVNGSQEPQQIRNMDIEGPVREAPASVVATVETVGVVADTTLAGAATEEQPSHEETESVAKLFTEEEVPQVEDFFSFLNRSAEQPVVQEVEEHVFELPKEPSRMSLSEGTGEPRPLTPPVPPVPAKPVEIPKVEAKVEMELPLDPEPAPKPVIEQKTEPVQDEGVQANWDRMPRHLQTLFGASGKEVAQHSYKAFKETREGLIQRLLDPTISLEEAARILNVCPTTVRRYTNRGVLKHFRTAGNQRRFRLSDVLVFMEGGQATDDASSEED